ncbi:hypothetical protein [Glaciimonas immobilis]|uniref:Portal protein n=1 Tax=Glaciimonas immobilis TaxID=728004 RepID=A0A840RSZ3_9BURK|nr:hypothetical protein [Glaciimonas immobilis]KAF3997541.1 hypothetical protein HAV38_12750 [Glaciimonas immobilis]MBB5200773.1 hypothetical protein [Glaciimonas immobilis]
MDKDEDTPVANKAADDVMKNYATDKSLQEKLGKIYEQITAGFKEEKATQSKNIDEYWDIYNCELGDHQQYSGDATVFEPIVHDAIEARRKRFTGMTFPNVGSNIEVVSEQGDTPQATLSILQQYVKKTNLRAIVSTLFLNGDVEGQWSIMPDWKRKERTITMKVAKDDGMDDYPDVEEQTIVDEGPEVTVIAAQDLWVFPSTVSDIQDAEIVCVALRLTDDAIEEKVDEGVFLKSAVKKLQKDAGEDQVKWAEKARSGEAGIKIKAGQKFALVYMAFAKLKLNGKKCPAIIYFGGSNNVLGVIKNPYWSQKIPVISESVNKVAGSFWGKSMVAPVAGLQYQLNDISNMGQDSAMYTLMPIVLTDPLKNPRYSSMIMAMAAVWETNPNDTKILEFPPLYQHALTLRNSIKSQIMETMEVNETMLGKAPAGRKNAAAVGQQGAEAMATIGDHVKRFEQGVMNLLLEWFYELDMQFREDDLTIIEEGEHGIKATLEKIPPQQIGKRYWFKWLGADKAIGAQNVQQMIGFANVLRGMGPQVLNGRRLDLGPLVDFASSAIFGPTMAQNILIDERHKLSVPPEVENEMLLNNLPVEPSPMDNDTEHIQAHQNAAQQTGDPTGVFRNHIVSHTKAIQAKMVQQQPKGNPGIPGQGGQPGVAGMPRQGAMPAGPRNGAQQPPGAISQDSMQDGQAGMRG